MRGVLILLFVFWFSVHASAQINPAEVRHHVIIKYFPLSMYDIDNTFQAGVEIPVLKSRFGIQQEAGYGHTDLNFWYRSDGKDPDKQILKSRTQLRFYFYQGARVRGFVAGEYLFKQVTNYQTQWVGRDCADGGCGYFENKQVKLGRFVHAGHLKAGWQFSFPHRMTMDIFGGFGIRSISVRSLTPGAESVRQNDSWLNWGIAGDRAAPYTVEAPSVSLGFSIGFALGKFKRTANPGPVNE